MNATFAKQVFRANDIRGLADTELTDEFAIALGNALGKKTSEQGNASVMLCRDARLSSPRLHRALIQGLQIAGCNIIDLGIGPTPLLGFALATSGLTPNGVMITASHNPKYQNGFKISLDGKPFFGEQLEALYADLDIETPSADDQAGNVQTVDFKQKYIDHLKSDIADLSGIKIVVDAANGAAGPLASAALKAVGLKVVEQFCDLDGNFPNRSPDTSKAGNLALLCQRVIAEQADAGIGFDGDGDRFVAVTHLGRLLDADDLITVLAESALEHSPNSKIVYDVKCSSSVGRKISDLNGKGIMERSGRSYIHSRMLQEKAAFAGEYSAHYFFADRWFATDDGIYAACRLLELCKQRQQSLEQICPPVSGKVATSEIYLPVPDADKFRLVDAIRQYPELEIAGETPSIILIDGLRIEYEEGWALVRASNTEAALTLRFESSSEAFMADLKTKMVSLLKSVSAGIEIDGIEHVT